MDDQKEREVELTADSLASGDRPSLFYFGMVGAHAIRKDNMAVFMVDALGRVCIMPPSSIKVLHAPRVSEEDLNLMPEEVAINILARQGDTDEQIVEYLARRPQT